MKLRKSLCVVVAVLSGGCAHLEQAPLVYSSKTSFGLDVSTASTESPSIAMSVGYKQVDAAYVPVAVARACRESAVNCDGFNYKLELISGRSLSGSNDDGLSEAERVLRAKQAFEQYKKALADYNDAYRGFQDAAKDASVLQAKLDTLMKQQQDANEQRDKEERDKARAEAAARSGASPPDARPDTAVAVVASWGPDKDAELKKTTDELKRALDAQAQLQLKERSLKAALDAEEQRNTAAKALVSQSNRGDAYSVFGSFTAGDEVGGEKVSFGLGKMFSTGVASQNLSEGVALSMCYQAVAKFAGASNVGQEQMKAMLEDCRRRTPAH